MDHEKPEVVVPQVVDFHPHQQTRSPVIPDADYVGPPSINEAENVEDPKDRRGENVWRTLSERHLNMIAFSGYAFIIASRIITNTEQEQLAMAFSLVVAHLSLLLGRAEQF